MWLLTRTLPQALSISAQRLTLNDEFNRMNTGRNCSDRMKTIHPHLFNMWWLGGTSLTVLLCRRSHAIIAARVENDKCFALYDIPMNSAFPFYTRMHAGRLVES